MDVVSVSILCGAVGYIGFRTIKRPFTVARNHAVNSLKIALKEATELRKNSQVTDATVVMERWYEKYSDLPDGDKLLSGYYTLGMYYAEANRLSDAAPLLKRSLTLYKADEKSTASQAKWAATAQETLARFYVAQDSNDEAIHCFRHASECWERAGEFQLAMKNRAFYYKQQGDFRNAAKSFNIALSHNPDSLTQQDRIQIFVERMLSLLFSGDYSECLVVAREVATTYTRKSIGTNVYRMIALTYANNGDFEEAEMLLKSIALEDKTPEQTASTLDCRCLLLADQGRYSEIVALNTEYIASGKEASSQIYNSLGGALFALGKLDDAEAAYRIAIEESIAKLGNGQKIQVARNQITLAWVRIHQGAFDDAMVLLSEAEWAGTKSKRTYFLIRSRRLFGEAYQQCLTDAELKTGVGQLLLEFDEEEKTFQAKTDFLRHYAPVLLDIAHILFMAGDSVGSLQILDRFGTAEMLAPASRLKWHYWRGRCFEEIGDISSARTTFQLALQTSCDPLALRMQEARQHLLALGDESVNNRDSNAQ